MVDASALLSIYLGVPERADFLDVLTSADALLMSPVNVWEVMVRAGSVHGSAGTPAAEALLQALAITVPPLGAPEVRAAADAFACFGRRTPAGLNLGDCFAYALARAHDAPLLFKGKDFARTDVKRAD